MLLGVPCHMIMAADPRLTATHGRGDVNTVKQRGLQMKIVVLMGPCMSRGISKA